MLEDGSHATGVDVYVGTPRHRPTLVRDGRPLRLAEVPYAEVDALVPAR